jgi:hypothetical protein
LFDKSPPNPKKQNSLIIFSSISAKGLSVVRWNFLPVCSAPKLFIYSVWIGKNRTVSIRFKYLLLTNTQTYWWTAHQQLKCREQWFRSTVGFHRRICAMIQFILLLFVTTQLTSNAQPAPNPLQGKHLIVVLENVNFYF